MPHARYQISNQARVTETDRQSSPPLLPPPSLLNLLLLSPLRVPGTPHSPPDKLYRGVTGCGQSLIDSLLMLLFPQHTHTALFFFYTHTHSPRSPPPLPPPARALVWVLVIASGLVPCRLHRTIHTNQSVSALWMGPFWLCPCKVRPPLEADWICILPFWLSLSFSCAHKHSRCTMKPAQKDK